MLRTGKVLLIYTGGTIGMDVNPKTGSLEPLDFHHLVARVPEFDTIATGIDVYQFTPPIDSSDMSPQMWEQIVKIINDGYNSAINDYSIAKTAKKIMEVYEKVINCSND